MSNTELVTIRPAATESREAPSSRQEDVEGEPTDGRGREQELAPTDGGLAAWRLLCAAFMFEALLWGTLFRKLNAKTEIDRVQASPSPSVYSKSTILRSLSLQAAATSPSWEP